MYNNLLTFRDINVFSKIFSFIFCVASIFIVNNPLYYFLFILLFYIFFQNRKILLIEFVLALLFSMFNIFGGVLKFIFFVSSCYLLIKIIDFGEVRYFIESLFYRKRQAKLSYICLYICYFFKYYFYYFKDFMILIKSYGKKLSFSTVKYIVRESFSKTKIKINNLMILYRYRFYNSSDKRTYVGKSSITSLDIKYVLIFVIIFLIIYVYGR